MTTQYHSPIVVGESNSPDTINTRLSTLDSGISANVSAIDARIDNLIIGAGTSAAEVVDARIAGNTDGSSPAVLSDRIALAAANAYHPVAYGAAGDGSTDDRAVLNTLVNTTMSAGGTVLIDRVYRIATDLTVPAGVTLQFVTGGRFDVETYTIRSAAYRWQLSASGTATYYLQTAAGGDPGLTGEPGGVIANGVPLARNFYSALEAGQWSYAAGDSLGYSTIYVRLADDADPDGKAADYVVANRRLVVNGTIEGPPSRIFENYTQFFGTASAERILPQWWHQGGADWKPALQAALNTARAISSVGSKPTVFLLPQTTYACNSGIVIDIGQAVLHGQGSVLDFSGAAATVTAITITQTDPTYRKDHYSNPVLHRVTLRGPGQATASTGVLINTLSHTGGVNIQPAITNVTIGGFGTGLSMYNNAWGLVFDQGCIYGCGVALKDLEGANSGERYDISHSLIGENDSALSPGYGDWHFVQCSLDYNTEICTHDANNTITLDACRLESASESWFTLTNTNLTISNSVIWYSGATAETTLISYTATNLGSCVNIENCRVVASPGINIRLVNGTTGRVNVRGLRRSVGDAGAPASIIVQQANSAPDNGFEGASVATLWALAGSAAVSAAQAHSGTKSLLIPNGSNAGLYIPFVPGKMVEGEFWLRTGSAITSSGVFGGWAYLAHDKTTPLGSNTNTTRYPLTVTAQTWTKVGFYISSSDAPAGTAWIAISLSNGLGGDVYIDDVIVNVY